MPLPLIIAGLAALTSLTGELLRKKEEEAAIRKKKKALLDAKIDLNEEEAIMSNINRGFNTQALGAANSAALGLSSILNSDTLRGLNASTMLGQRASTIAEAKMKVLDTNRQIDMAISSGLPFSQGINAGNIAMGGLMGYQIGEEIESLKSKKPNPTDTTDTTDNTLSEIPKLNKSDPGLADWINGINTNDSFTFPSNSILFKEREFGMGKFQDIEKLKLDLDPESIEKKKKRKRDIIDYMGKF